MGCRRLFSILILSVLLFAGTSNIGRAVAAGVYLTRLTAGNMTATGKLALVK